MEYNFEQVCCEYKDCEKTATTYDTELEAWLCEHHSNSIDNTTGYCTKDCQLGYGCDGSC